ncbi:MAG TPA: hypothetical protein VIJ88_01645 [Candidatus Paceibacterota bacterium]
MPTSGLHIDVASIPGNGITPPATVVCVEKAGCQTGFGQSIATALVQGAVGSAMNSVAITHAAHLAARQTGSASVQNTLVKVNATGGNAKATGGNASNSNLNSSTSTSTAIGF